MRYLIALLFILISDHSIARADNRKTSIYVIGSIHNLHKSQIFNEHRFTSILKNIKPGKVLLEFPLDWFDRYGKPIQDLKESLENESEKDGIRDGQLAWKYCKSHRIPCLPFDIKGRNEFFKKNNFFSRLALFQFEIEKYVKNSSVNNEGYESLSKLIESCKKMDPVTLNSKVCDQIFESNESFLYQLYLEAKKDNAIQDPEFYQIQKDFWQLRNQTMADQICEIAKNSNGRKLAVITGVDHHYYLVKLLSQCHYAKLETWK